MYDCELNERVNTNAIEFILKWPKKASQSESKSFLSLSLCLFLSDCGASEKMQTFGLAWLAWHARGSVSNVARGVCAICKFVFTSYRVPGYHRLTEPG